MKNIISIVMLLFIIASCYSETCDTLRCGYKCCSFADGTGQCYTAEYACTSTHLCPIAYPAGCGLDCYDPTVYHCDDKNKLQQGPATSTPSTTQPLTTQAPTTTRPPATQAPTTQAPTTTQTPTTTTQTPTTTTQAPTTTRSPTNTPTQPSTTRAPTQPQTPTPTFAPCPAPLLGCGPACYSPNQYHCVNGQLQQGPASGTNAPTQPQTQAPTQPQTQAPTQPQTQAPTQPQTQAPTQPQTPNPSTTGQPQTMPGVPYSCSMVTCPAGYGCCLITKPQGWVEAECYLPSQWECVQGKTMCPLPLRGCGLSCYDTTHYNCDANGNLTPK